MKISIQDDIKLIVREGDNVNIQRAGNTIIITVELRTDIPKRLLWDSERFIDCQQTKSLSLDDI